MNQIPFERKKLLLDLLVEGGSLRGISRATGHHRNTIVAAMHEASQGCAQMMDERFVGLGLKHLQVDEIWTFLGIKRDKLPKGETDSERGDQFLWTALDAESKLIPAYYIGKRTNENALRFMHILRTRVSGSPQLSTDAFWGYRDAVDFSFGTQVDYAQVTKVYRTDWQARHETYSPRAIARVTTSIIRGNPDPKHVSTSFVERHNLTIRQHLRRFARMSLGFSRKLECLASAVTIFMWAYNFKKSHRTLHGATPAMAAGIVKGFLD